MTYAYNLSLTSVEIRTFTHHVRNLLTNLCLKVTGIAYRHNLSNITFIVKFKRKHIKRNEVSVTLWSLCSSNSEIEILRIIVKM